mgnify:CR=1 FL=1
MNTALIRNLRRLTVERMGQSPINYFLANISTKRNPRVIFSTNWQRLTISTGKEWSFEDGCSLHS